jgi:hypothetical protein
VSGEMLFVAERLVVAPVIGVFRPTIPPWRDGEAICRGQVVGTVVGPGTSTAIRSPFSGRLMGMLAWAGERVRCGQPVAWIR